MKPHSEAVLMSELDVLQSMASVSVVVQQVQEVLTHKSSTTTEVLQLSNLSLHVFVEVKLKRSLLIWFIFVNLT